MKRLPALVLIISLASILILTAGCKEDDENSDDTYKYYQSGTASWYGKKFHGRKTSNGEIYNMYAYTAAHKKLPFNTKVKVVNQNNQKEVIVRINDRGPYIAGRIIDLSYAAAKDINIVNSGTAPVKLYILDESGSSEREQKYFIQIGAFIKKKNAVKLRNKARKYSKRVHIISQGGKFKVLVGPFNNEQDAKNVLKRIRKKSNINGFITREYYPF